MRPVTIASIVKRTEASMIERCTSVLRVWLYEYMAIGWVDPLGSVSTRFTVGLLSTTR